MFLHRKYKTLYTFISTYTLFSAIWQFRPYALVKKKNFFFKSLLQSLKHVSLSHIQGVPSAWYALDIFSTWKTPTDIQSPIQRRPHCRHPLQYSQAGLFAPSSVLQSYFFMII